MKGHAVKRHKSLLVLVLLVLLMITIDKYIWSVADLSRYVGKSEGISAPLDSIMSEILSPTLKREKLIAKLKVTTDVKEYGKTLGALAKLLDEMKLIDEKDVVMVQAVQRFGEVRNPDIIAAYEFLIKQRLKNNISSDARLYLGRLRDLALTGKPDGPLLQKVIDNADGAGFTDFVAKVAEMAHPNKRLPTGVRLLMLRQLLIIRREEGNLAEVAKLEELSKQYSERGGIERLVKEQMISFYAKVKKKEYNEALVVGERIEKMFPDYSRITTLMYWRIANEAVRHKRPELFRQMWEIIPARGVPDDESAEKKFRSMLNNALMNVSPGTEPELFRKIFAEGEKISFFDKTPYYYAGEKWVADGRKGKPPKQFYTIAHRPDAAVKLDGNLDEAVYGSLESLPGAFFGVFNGSDTENRPAGRYKLDVKMFHTETDIYIGVKVPEPHVSDIRLNLPSGLHKQSWQDDCIEIFFAPGRGYGNYYQFVCTPNGTFYRYDYDSATPKKEMTEEQYPVFGSLKTDEAYILEIKIPLSNLPNKGKWSGKLVNFNIRRNRWVQGAMQTELPGAEKIDFCTVGWCNTDDTTHGWAKFEFVEFE